jgi:hypothetical protein
MDTWYEEIIYESVFRKNTTKRYGTLACQLAKICDAISVLCYSKRVNWWFQKGKFFTPSDPYKI